MEETIICQFCGKKISKEKYRKHLKSKHEENFKSIFDLTIHVLDVVENLTDEFITNIISDYTYNSVLYIEEKYNFRFRKYIDDLKLTHKSISDSNLTKNTLEKRKKTFIKIYGVDNPSKDENIKDKKRKTFLKNYGVDNIWKLKEYRLWWEDEMMKKYGQVCLSNLYDNQNSFVWKTINENDKKIRIKKLRDGFEKWYNGLNDEELINYVISRCKNAVFYQSSLEKRIESILIENNIEFNPQKWINKFPYDFCFGNKILEVQGTYWHCDPKIYNSNDIIKRNGDELLVEDIWNKDILKKINAEKYGYNVFYLWELELNEMSDIEILEFIKKFI